MSSDDPRLSTGITSLPYLWVMKDSTFNNTGSSTLTYLVFMCKTNTCMNDSHLTHVCNSSAVGRQVPGTQWSTVRRESVISEFGKRHYVKN